MYFITLPRNIDLLEQSSDLYVIDQLFRTLRLHTPIFIRTEAFVLFLSALAKFLCVQYHHQQGRCLRARVNTILITLHDFIMRFFLTIGKKGCQTTAPLGSVGAGSILFSVSLPSRKLCISRPFSSLPLSLQKESRKMNARLRELTFLLP